MTYSELNSELRFNIEKYKMLPFKSEVEREELRKEIYKQTALLKSVAKGLDNTTRDVKKYM